jgi:hypothetical protein
LFLGTKNTNFLYTTRLKIFSSTILWKRHYMNN